MTLCQIMLRHLFSQMISTTFLFISVSYLLQIFHLNEFFISFHFNIKDFVKIFVFNFNFVSSKLFSYLMIVNIK